MDEPTVADAAAEPRHQRWRPVLLLVVVSASLAALAGSVAGGFIDRHTIERLVVEPGPKSMLLYVGLVFCLELLWCPRMWGLLAGGLIFGPWRGALLSLVADMLSASFCFALARGGGRSWVAARLATRPRARAAVALLAERRGALTVALLRILPAHFTAVSYAAGLAGVRFGRFFWGTLAGALPGAVLYNAVGDAARQPASPTFIAGAIVLAVLAVAGAVCARRLWRRPELLEPAGVDERCSAAGGPSSTLPASDGSPCSGGAEGN